MNESSISDKLSGPSSVFLDLLRGLSVQAVLIGHAISFFGITQKTDFIQNSGVVLLFVLSGFLITYSALKKKENGNKYSFSSYLFDRFSRIYTSLVPVLLVVVILDFLLKSISGTYGYSNAFNLQTFFANLFMLQDFPFQDSILNFLKNTFSFSPDWLIPVTSFGSARPLWVLPILWWTYLSFGWIVLGKYFREKNPVVYWLVLLVFLYIPLSNIYNIRANGLPLVWFMGLFAYLALFKFSIKLPNKYALLLAIVCFLAALIRLLQKRNPYEILFPEILTLALFFSLYYLQRVKIVVPQFISSIIKFIADYSFTLFLVHYTLLCIFQTWFGPGVLNLIISLLLCNLAAVGLYFAFERHDNTVRRWLKRIFRVAA